jgi:hypothetical protein
MSRSELGTIPAPPTEAELDHQRLSRLRRLAEGVQKDYNNPYRLRSLFVRNGFKVEDDEWDRIREIRDFVMRLWMPPIGGIV